MALSTIIVGFPESSFRYSDAMFAVVSVVIVTAFVVSFVYGRRAREQRLPVEIGRTPLFETTCGAWVGALRVGRPGARVAVYDDMVVIRAPIQEIVIRPSDITDVQLIHGLRAGVRISTSGGAIPSSFLIFTGDDVRDARMHAAVSRVAAAR